jgi:release factor glutamine methyltransferase
MNSQQSAISSQQSAVKDKEQLCLSQKKREPANLVQVRVSSLLAEAVAELTLYQIANPRLEAEVLLAYVLATDRAGLYTHLRDPISSSRTETFRHLIQRRAQHEPLQYITGTQEFWSLPFMVDKRVLIPRPETEVVVETALRLISQSTIHNPQSAIQILDVGTGSGCIAIALAKELSHAQLWATDVSSDALRVARNNAEHHDVARQITFLQGDLFAPIADKTVEFEIIVSNPPYLVHDEIATLQPEICDWEPHCALDGGRDGLDFYRRLLSESPAFLCSGGWLIMEIGQGQRQAIMRMVQEQPYLRASFSVPDYSGHDRVVVVCKV